MKKKILVLISILILLLIMSVGALIFFSKPLPPGSYEINGLKAPVSIQRDSFGIPYIRASNKADLYLGLGFMHAEDRIFQIDFLRRLVSGRLSEVLGPAALKKDKLFLQLRFVEHQKELRKNYPGMFKGAWFEELNAYVAGLNQFIEMGRFPIEYKILSTKPKFFEIEEVLAIGGYMAYGFAHGSRSDAVFGELFKALKPEVFESIWKTYPKSGPIIAAPGAFHAASLPSDENTPQNHSVLQTAHLSLKNTFDLEWDDHFAAFYGSNSWVVGPQKSATGNAVLVNDPHIGYSNPSVWYEASLHCPDFKVQGHFLSGFPFALVGHGVQHAWALTMLSQDDMDLYLETIDWSTKKVKRGQNWIPLKEYSVDIPVKNSAPVSYTVTWTDIGPLIDSHLNVDFERPVSLFWAYFDPENNIFNAFHGINNHANLETFQQSLSEIIAPGLNISYANSNGDIAWWAAGRFLNRGPDNPGHLPMDGNDFQQHATKYYPFSSNPKLINPPQGYIITANNHPTGDDIKPGYYQPADRAARIEQLLQQKPKLSIEDHKRILSDSHSFLHLRVKDRLCDILTKTPEADQTFNDATKILCEWNGQHEPREIGATLFQEWLVQIRIQLTEGLIPKILQKKWLALTHSNHFLYALFDSWDSNLLRLKNISMDQAVSKAFSDTLVKLSKTYGQDMQTWNWGRAHTVTYRHPLGSVQVLKFLNLGPYPAPGLKDGINAVGANYNFRRFHASSGPSTRRIVNLQNVDESYSILPTGNSGNIFSTHYDDQVKIYLDKGFKKIPLIEYEKSLLPAEWKLVPSTRQ